MHQHSYDRKGHKKDIFKELHVKFRIVAPQKHFRTIFPQIGSWRSDLRALEIAITKRHDFLSQALPSPTKPQCGCLHADVPRISQEESQSLAIFHCTQTSQGFSGQESLGPNVAVILSPGSDHRNVIAEKQRHLMHSSLASPQSAEN